MATDGQNLEGTEEDAEGEATSPTIDIKERTS